MNIKIEATREMEKKKFEKLREDGREQTIQANSEFDFTSNMERKEPHFSTKDSDTRMSQSNIRFIRDNN
jgi:hypothetical protein